MKQLILKSAAFVVPFAILYLFFKIFYVTDRGDLLKLGYFIDHKPHPMFAIQ